MKNQWSALHPFIKSILFLSSLVLFNIAFLAIAIAVNRDTDISLDSMSIGGMKLLTFFNQVIGFLLPAVLFGHLIGMKNLGRFHLKRPSFSAILLTTVALLVSLGFLHYIGELNVKLLDLDVEIFNTLREFEKHTVESLEALLVMNGPFDLVINILLIGLTPAICEEFAFRGALQSQLAQVFKNSHLAIWVTAFIFSFIHFQFLGFFPRMIFGAFFGYLVIFTGSLWPAILAHFLNNALGVVTYYLAQNTDLYTVEQLENASVSWYLGLLSMLFTLLILWLIRKNGKESNLLPEYEQFPKPD